MNSKCQIIILIIFLSINSSAQVTIGSGIEPNSGCLLDLKESQSQDGEENSSKGVNMPRVALVNKTTLQPMYSYENGNTPTEDDLKDHVGLMVYNTNESDGFCKGIYVWKGQEWVTLYNIPFKPDLTVYDTDNNRYIARWYVHDPCSPTGGAYWLTSNLRTTRQHNGSNFAGGLRLNPGKYFASNGAVVVNSRADLPTTTTSKSVSYKENGLTVTLSYDEFASQFGLLYKWGQAENACPPGWRLATNTDWANLFKAIGAGTEDKDKKLMGNNWSYQPNDWSVAFTNGGGYPPSDPRNFGFFALPAGGVHSSGTSAEKFAESCYWWSQSDGGEHVVWYLNWEPAVFGGDKAEVFVDYYFSVRCVRD